MVRAVKHACIVLLATLGALGPHAPARAQGSVPAPATASPPAADAGAPLAPSDPSADGSPQPATPAAPLRIPDVIRVPQLAIPTQLALRAQRLGRDLDALGERDSGRLTSSIVQLGVGAVFATLGAVLKNEIGRSLLLLVGAGTMAHGGFQLALHEDAGDLAESYRALPMVTPGLAAERVAFGERALTRIARGARRGRIADGSVAMGVAAVYVPLLWWLQKREDDAYRFGDSAFDYVALALSGINFASGLVTALVRTDAERRLHDYEALRARVTGGAARPALTWRIGPARAGAVFAGGLRF